MSDESPFAEAAERYLAETLARDRGLTEDGSWSERFWQGAEAQGLTLASTPMELGGSGGDLCDEMAVVAAAGRTAAPLPIAETCLSGWLLAKHGIAPPRGPLGVGSAVAAAPLVLEDGRVHGVIPRVPWGRYVSAVVAVASGRLVLLEAPQSGLTFGSNIAGEPRDSMSFDGSMPIAIGEAESEDFVTCRGAAIRATQMSAAAATALELAVNYSKERTQFGQTIGSFQAIQQMIAVATSQVASSYVAAQLGYRALESRTETSLYSAIAKGRASEAAGTVVGIVHQIVGAMGFTAEYPLQRYTRRLQSWRLEFGGEAYWQERLGTALLRRGSDPWSILTATSSR